MLWTWSTLLAAAALAFVAIAAPADNYYDNDAPLLPAELDSPGDFDCTGKDDGAHGVGCSKDYWLCWKGVATEQWCPTDLMFNVGTKQCDYFNNIFECSGVQPTPSTILSDFAIAPHVDFDCSGLEDGDHPYTSDCQENYVSCVAGIPYNRPCPDQLLFDPVNRFCDRPEHIVACGGSLPNSGFDVTSDYGTPEPVDFDCANMHDGNYAYAKGELCQPKFVACAGGVAWELKCPDGLLFDPDQLRCERNDAILACGGTIKPVTQPTTTFAAEPATRPRHYTKNPIPSAEPSIQRKYETPVAKPITTEGYYETTTSRIAAETTTQSYYTTTPRIAEATTQASYYETTPSVLVAAKSSACSGKPDGDYPTGLCVNLFFSCWKNELTERTCPDDHVFDSRTRICEHPRWVESCPESKTTTPAPSTIAVEKLFGHDSYAANYNPSYSSASSYSSNSGSYNPPSSSYEASTYSSYGGYSPSYSSAAPSYGYSASYNPAPTQSYSAVSYGSESANYNPSYSGGYSSSYNNQYDSSSRCRGNEKIALGECKDEFIVCKDGVEIRKWCPAETVFDIKSLNCAATSSLPECAPASPPSRCYGNVEKISLGECLDEFIACKSGKEIHKWCPSGTIFDTRALNCAPINSVPGCAPTTPPSRCKGNEKIALGDCNDEFILCMDGIELHKWCPSGTVFDSVSLTCAYRCVIDACSESAPSPATAAPSEDVDVGRNFRTGGFDPFVDEGGFGGFVGGFRHRGFRGGRRGFRGGRHFGGRHHGGRRGFEGVGRRGFGEGFGRPGFEGVRPGFERERFGRPGFDRPGFGRPGFNEGFGRRRIDEGFGGPGFNEGFGGPGLDDGFEQSGSDEGFGGGNIDPYALDESPRDNTFKRSRSHSRSRAGSLAWTTDEPTSHHRSGSDLGSSSRSSLRSGSEVSSHDSDSAPSHSDSASSHSDSSASGDLNSLNPLHAEFGEPSETEFVEASASDIDFTSHKADHTDKAEHTDNAEHTPRHRHHPSADLIEESDFSCTGKVEGDYAYRKCSSLYAHCAEDGKFKALFCQSPDMSYNEDKKRCVVDPDCAEHHVEEPFSYDDFDDFVAWDSPAAALNETGEAVNGTRRKRNAGFGGHRGGRRDFGHHRRGRFGRPFYGAYGGYGYGYGGRRIDPFALDGDNSFDSSPVYSNSDSGAPVWPSSPPAVNSNYPTRGGQVYGNRQSYNSNSYQSGYSGSDSGAPVWPSSPPATNSYYPTRGGQAYYDRSFNYGGASNYGGENYYDSGAPVWPSSPPATNSYYRAKRSVNETDILAGEGLNATRRKRNLGGGGGFRGGHGGHGGRHFDRRHGHRRGFGFGIGGRGYYGGYGGRYGYGYGRVDPFALEDSDDSSESTPAYQTATYASLDASLCAGKPDNYLHPLGVCSREYCICYQSKPYQQQCAEGDVFEPTISRCVRLSESTTCSPKQEPVEDTSVCAGKPNGFLGALGVCSREFCICYQGKPYQQQCAEGDVFEPQYNRCVPLVDSPTCSPQAPAKQSACDDKPDGYLSALGVCSREYCICYQGKPYQQECAEGDVFMPKCGRCLHAKLVPSCNPDLAGYRASYNQASSYVSAAPTYNQASAYAPTTAAYYQPSAYAQTTAAYYQPSAYASTAAAYNQRSSYVSAAPTYGYSSSYNQANTYKQERAQVYTYTVPYTTPSTTPYYNPYGRLPAAQSKVVTDERCRDIPEGDTRAIGRCRQDYLECRIGQALVRFCSEALVFDSATRTCAARASLPQCSNAKSAVSYSGSYGSYGSEGSVTSLCQTRGDGYNRHPTDCARFVQCFRGNAFVLNCASGLVFNPAKEVCDYPVNVPDCHTPGDTATVQDAECANRTDGAFFRDTQDCKVFYRCVHGRRLKFDCPDSTVFNERLNVCDYPTAVPECGGDAPAPY